MGTIGDIMKIDVTLNDASKASMFYQDITQDSVVTIQKISVTGNLVSLDISSDLCGIDCQKVFLNQIKQYMRDFGMEYSISVLGS